MSPPIARPVPGMGGTLLHHGDRHACTVTQVLSPTRVTVRRDRALRSDSHGPSGSQSYCYRTDPLALEQLFECDGSGEWREVDYPVVLVLGIRDEFYDFNLEERR